MSRIKKMRESLLAAWRSVLARFAGKKTYIAAGLLCAMGVLSLLGDLRGIDTIPDDLSFAAFFLGLGLYGIADKVDRAERRRRDEFERILALLEKKP